MYTIIVLSQKDINWMQQYYNMIIGLSSFFRILFLPLWTLSWRYKSSYHITDNGLTKWTRCKISYCRNAKRDNTFWKSIFLQRTKKKKLSKTDIRFCGSRSSPIPFITNAFPHQMLWIWKKNYVHAWWYPRMSLLSF